VVNNFRRRTTRGLSADFAFLNCVGFAAYATYNVTMFYSKYIQDVTTLQKQIEELDNFIKETTRTQLADEFSRADYDENNKVSRAEFEQYKREYIRKHPDMANQFPAFEEFDPDHNGMITLREHQAYYEDRGMI